MLRFDHVTKYYSSNPVLNDVSIEFKAGKLYALVGPNGSGKTTLMKAAAGLVKPENGTIFFNNTPISPATKAHIAYMPTEPYYYNFMTIAKVAQYHKDFFPDFDMEYFKKLLNYMSLTENLKVKSLSSGMAAKLKIAVTLARRSSVIMLDEPLNGIDVIARDQIISSIIASASQGSCFIISSHLFDELEPIVNDIVMVRAGQIIINGDINEVRRANNKSISDLYREVYGAGMFNPYGMPYGAPNMPQNLGGYYNGQGYAPYGQMQYPQQPAQYQQYPPGYMQYQQPIAPPQGIFQPNLQPNVPQNSTDYNANNTNSQFADSNNLTQSFVPNDATDISQLNAGTDNEGGEKND